MHAMRSLPLSRLAASLICVYAHRPRRVVAVVAQHICHRRGAAQRASRMLYALVFGVNVICAFAFNVSCRLCSAIQPRIVGLVRQRADGLFCNGIALL
jgi:hypothetical protein